MNARQVLHFVIRPTLTHIGYGGLAVEQLLLMTAAHESKFQYIDQITSRNDEKLGPAIGLYQMEVPTFLDHRKWLFRRPGLNELVNDLVATWPDPHLQLATNLAFATAMARVHYLRVPEKLPNVGDYEAMAKYAKRYWNTEAGKAKWTDYFDAFRELKL